MKRYNFRKPIRKASPSEQVDLISISNFEEEKQKHNLQQEKKTPLHQKELHPGANSREGDTPPNSWIDSIGSPKVKTTEGQGVRARSLARSTLGVEGRARASGWGLGRVTNGSITHTDLHRPNNKLVSVTTLALGSRPK